MSLRYRALNKIACIRLLRIIQLAFPNSESEDNFATLRGDNICRGLKPRLVYEIPEYYMGRKKRKALEKLNESLRPLSKYGGFMCNRLSPEFSVAEFFFRERMDHSTLCDDICQT
ncbi:hypothetical protein AVEN_248689-1 [Araneus ventricosus]|uniref:Uncharacterized protein n=1 Tax=Araneus ventricosus TaxID=182803 RepID=A0A4Y2C2A6_ARAVE|nr:hypothetical protein AVEN_248689-1 [Araneus ventricosus]